MSQSADITGSAGAESSVGDAKLRLIQWGEDTDDALHQQMHDVMGAARSGTRRIVPWAVGAAVLLGLLAGRRRAKGPRPQPERGESGGSEGSGGRGRLWLRIALELLPLVTLLLKRRRD